ncbi:YggT family protein [Planctomonas psychrotolerans]|uniref:YggT family protein n=1 Tax=Planctomonas psychrotolerans TaxID=2528712 RepID=UPI001D0D2784|nr:YggT family protein [Planctomonas psychrotolerans]
MGNIVSLTAFLLWFALLLFILMMWGRFVLDLVQAFSREWRPRGAVLLLAEASYTVTDPPIRFVRKIIPPLRLGPVALDFGWMLTMLAAIILFNIAGSLR